MTTSTVSSKFQVVVPRDLREALDITPGTRLVFRRVDDALHVTKVPSLPEVRAMLKGARIKGPVREKHDRGL